MSWFRVPQVRVGNTLSQVVFKNSNHTQASPKPRSFLRRHFGKLFVLSAVGITAATLGLSLYTIDSATQHYGLIYHEPWQLKVLSRIPWRTFSRLWGAVHEINLPKFLRVRLFQLWTDVYGCNLDEMSEPLESYRNLQEFFTRKLKPGVRPLDPAPIVSPIDGTVFTFGELVSPHTFHACFQIKGLHYPVSHFLGNVPVAKKDKSLFYCIFYLAPGDYHGIHSPTDWSITSRIHFPGHLFPVAPLVIQYINSVFLQNERVVLEGEWKDGQFFSLTSVGATNVGSIAIKNEPDFRTNRKDQKALKLHNIPTREDLIYEVAQKAKKGEEIAFFHLGSCVVLVFEEDPSFKFGIFNGQKIKIGQSLSDRAHAISNE